MLRSGVASLAWVLVTAVSLGQTPPDPALVLQQARRRILLDVNQMQRYSCVQTITRHFSSPPGFRHRSCEGYMETSAQRKRELPLEAWDRLRFDVTVADGQEIYSWAGAQKFEGGDLSRMVSYGALGSGDFGAFLGEILRGNNISVKYLGPVMWEGREKFSYSYSIPASESQYHIRAGNRNFVTAHNGVFLLDPHSLDIAQLTVRTAELPVATENCQAVSTIGYQRLLLGKRQLLLPRETLFRAIDRNGGETVNLTTYSGCREYTGESQIRFDDPEQTAETQVSHEPPKPLPPGLPFRCRLLTPLDSKTAGAGDPIEAVLRSPLRDRDHAVLAPAGTVLHGRLMRVLGREQRQSVIEIGIHFEWITRGGVQMPFSAKPDLPSRPNSRSRLSSGIFPAAELGPNTGIFFFPGEHLTLREFDSDWLTAEQK